MPTLLELSRAVGGELAGPPDLELTGVGSLEGAGPGDIAPIDSETYVKLAQSSKAGAFLKRPGLDLDDDRPAITHDFPLVALNQAMRFLGLVRSPQNQQTHPTAVSEGDVAETAVLGPHAVVHKGAKVGARTVLAAHAVIEGGAMIGEDCIVEPGAVIQDGARIGNRVRIGANAVISRQGFGFTPGPGGPEMLHHIGTVVIEDDVNIGAGTTIDRARFDVTRIGTMTSLDNHVHIGHNCDIGARTYVAAQSGFAGNAYTGTDCLVGGQVGFANRAGVGDKSVVAAKSGVMKPFGPGSDLMWYPARPRRKILRLLAKMVNA